MKKALFYLTAIMTMAFLADTASAQKWQAKIDTLWASHRYEQVGDKYTLSNSNYTAMKGWSENGATIVYYWRIAPGHIRADLVYTPNYMRRPVFGIKVIRVNTGELMYEGTIATTSYKKEQTTIEAISDINIPADEYYRIEFTVNNPSYVNYIYYFLVQRENALPVATMSNMGGTGSHLFDFGTTDPLAPAGSAYDWAYVEGMVLSEHQHPCDYFMTIGALNSYMGFQTNGRVNNGTDFNRRVLFSVWDNGNTDEDPDLPEYMQAEVFDYNHEGVSGHGGGEGSTGSVMFMDKTWYWQPDHWVQFLLNVRPENVRIAMKDRHGNDSIAEAENTVMTAWYKMDNWPDWQYMASIRAAFLNQLIGGWYSFIENFGGNEGWGKHRVNYRHAFMRSAASGEWYNRNYVNFFPCYTTERPKSEASHGASGTMDNTFFLEYGGYNVHYDSAHYTSLLDDKTCVDTINLDRLNDRIDQALKLSNRYYVNQNINKACPIYPKSDWTVSSNDGVNPAHALDNNMQTHWYAAGDGPHTIDFSATEEHVITSFIVKSTANRCRLVDVYTSDNGQDWTLVADSIYMHNHNDCEVSLPHSIKTKNIRLVFYDHVHGNYVTMHDIVFKGAYDLDAIKQVAKEYIDNENALNYYATADLQEVKAVYADGTCTDAEALSVALKQMAMNGTLLKYGKAAQKNNVAADNAYLICATNNRGYLCATPDDKLTIKESTADGAQVAYTDKVDVTNPYNSWQVLSTERYADIYYLYNIGAKKYLSFKNGNPTLVAEPYALGVSGTGSRLTFSCTDTHDPANGMALVFDPASAVQPVTVNQRIKAQNFILYNNYNLRPENHATLALIEQATTQPRLDAAVERAGRILALEDGIVGSLADPAEKQTIADLYNNGSVAATNLTALEDALNKAQYIKIDAHHTYRIIADDGADQPNCITVNAPWLSMAGLADDASQMWTITPDASGYRFCSQQYGFDMQPIEGYGNLHLTAADKTFAYHLSQITEGSYYLSQGSFHPYTANSKGTNVAFQKKTADGAQWKIKPVESYSIKLNASGVGLMYVDFDTKIPEGVSAYIADHVNSDGVISLLQLNDAIPHSTAVVLKGEPYATVALPVAGRELEPYDGANILTGTMLKKTGLAKGTCYSLKTSGSKAVMKTSPVATTIADNKAYILSTEGMPALDTYTFDFENIIDSVTPIEGEHQASGTKPQTTYDLLGRPTDANTPGIKITNGKVTVNQ